MTRTSTLSDRVLVIGLDAATFHFIWPLVHRGSLPNLSRLVEEGASGVLKSVIPVGTPAGWTSIVTGTNPGKHGIFDFLCRKEGSYDIVPLNATFRAARSLWNIISEAGKHVGVLNVPVTYPPEPVSGFLVTGPMTPRGAQDVTYPPGLRKEIEEAVGGYKLHIDEAFYYGNEIPYLRDLYDTTESVAEACMYLIKRNPWDFFMVVFYEIDPVQHAFWQHADKNHPGHVASQEFQSAIEDYYIHIDDIIGQILREIGDQANVIVISDHGARQLARWIHLGSILMSCGYLKFKRRPLTLLKLVCFKLGLTPLFAYKVLTILRRASARKSKKPGEVHGILQKLFLSLQDVDWSRTRAYPLPGFGEISLNIKGREPSGIVEVPKIEDEKNGLIERLRSLKDDKTGLPLFKTIFRREEIYTGPKLENAPDILPTPSDGYAIFSDYELASNSAVTDAFGTSAAHDEDGIIIMNGPRIKGPVKIEGASVIDVAPTVLYLLGLPIPSTIDGKVLTDAITGTTLSERPIVTEAVEEKATKRRAYTGDEEEDVKEILRRLGYLM